MNFSKQLKALSILLIIFLFVSILNLSFGVLTYRYLVQNDKITRELFVSTQKILADLPERSVLGATNDVIYADSRVAYLHNFLTRYNSPLVPYAEELVKIADENGIHYGLLPAIAMVESNLCKKIPDDSFNCWGWGIYGKTVTRFSSFSEAMDTVARGLKKNYIDKGYVTPEQIMVKYNPTNHNNWLGGVNFFFGKFE